MKKYTIRAKKNDSVDFGTKEFEAKNKKEARVKFLGMIQDDTNVVRLNIEKAKKKIREGKKLLRKSFIRSLFNSHSRFTDRMVMTIILETKNEIFLFKKEVKAMRSIVKGKFDFTITEVKEAKPKTIVERRARRKATLKTKGKK